MSVACLHEKPMMSTEAGTACVLKLPYSAAIARCRQHTLKQSVYIGALLRSSTLCTFAGACGKLFGQQNGKAFQKCEYQETQGEGHVSVLLM